MQTHRRTLLAQAAILAIQIYRNTLSKLVLPSCRFLPSCSAYAINAIERYGALRGGWRALSRLLRCHPFSRGGIDPVEPHPRTNRGFLCGGMN